MGNAKSSGDENETKKSESKKKTGKGSLRVSTDWRAEKQDQTEKPNIVDVDHLLRYTTTKVNYHPNPPNILVEKIPVPYGYVFRNVLTEDECLQYIQISEEMGYEPAPLRNLDTVNSNNFTLDDTTKDIRNSLRVLFDAHDDVGRVLNERILPHLPDEVDIDGTIWCKQVMGGGLAECPLNKRWRFNKYHAGQFFKPHFDAGYVYSKNEATIMTFILYLNGGIDGGETCFYPDNKKSFNAREEPGIEYSVIPEAGMCLIFLQTGSQNPRHEGKPHRSEGQYKYILRSDIAYFRKEPK
jgi:hypothetical protein